MILFFRFLNITYMPGNIRVFCRCRPLSAREVTGKCASIVNFDAAKDGELGVISNGSTKKTFKFDRVYSPNDDQGFTPSILFYIEFRPFH